MKQTHYRIEVSRGKPRNILKNHYEFPIKPTIVENFECIWVSVLLTEYDDGNWEVE